MDKYTETFETWNKNAGAYQDKFMHLDIYNQTYDFICNILGKQNASILDVGCGPGNITKYLLEKRPDFKIDGIDIAPNMIELAKKNNPGARFHVMDTRNINTLDKNYDAIVCGFCLPYLSTPDTYKLLQDCSALLHEKGILYISFMEGDPQTSGFMKSSSGDRVFFYFHELGSLKQNLMQLGFEVLEIFKILYKKNEPSGEIHTVLIARKTDMC